MQYYKRNPTTTDMTKYITFFLAFFAASVVTVCADTNRSKEEAYGNLVITAPIAKPLALEEAKRVVIATAVGREWRIVSAEGNKVVANLTHRRHDATLTFVISDSQIRVFSESYRLDRNQNRVKREDPPNWIRNIDRDLNRRIAEAIYDL